MRSDWLYLAVILILISALAYFLFLSDSSVNNYQKLSNQLDNLFSELEEIRHENALLKSELERKEDKEFIKSILAERHKLARKDELLVEIHLPEIITNEVKPPAFYETKSFWLTLSPVFLLALAGAVIYLRRKLKPKSFVIQPGSRIPD